MTNQDIENDKSLIEKLERMTKYDVRKEINFQCLIGKTEVILSIIIEPDPRGDETGTYSHFHTLIFCPYTKIVDIPEPDKCHITNKACRFIGPLNDAKDPRIRKGIHSHEIINQLAHIEFYGLHILNKFFAKKDISPIKENLRPVELARIMLISGLIDKDTFEKIEKLRKLRNKLAYKPKAYLYFKEKDLLEWSMEARDMSNVLKEVVEK